MATTTKFALTIQATTNTYKSYIMWEEVDNEGTPVVPGVNNWASEGPLSYRLGATTLQIKGPTGDGIEFPYSALYSYSIYGVVTDLHDIHDIWDSACQGALIAL